MNENSGNAVKPVRNIPVSDLVLVLGTVAILSFLAEMIGNVSIPVYVTNIALFPFLWALLACIIVSLILRRTMSADAAYIRPQLLASEFVQIAILLFIAKLGFIVGANVVKIIEAGPF